MMKKQFLAISASLLIGQPCIAAISAYRNSTTFYIPSVAEASGVSYNRDTGTLFVVDDEGTAITQIDKTGRYIDHMTLQHNVPREDRAVSDAEGITYLGNGRFMVADEREMAGRIITYQAGTMVTKTQLSSSSHYFGSFAGNTGLEGVAFDPLTNSIWGVKETAPISIFNMTGIPQLTGIPGSSTSLTEPLLGRPLNRMISQYGLTQLSDIYVMAASAAFSTSQNILLLARDSRLILEVDRAGNVVDTLDISSFGRMTIEGITMDDEGNIYLVSEENPNVGGNDGMSGLHMLSAVPEPSSALLGAIGCLFLLRRRR